MSLNVTSFDKTSHKVTSFRQYVTTCGEISFTVTSFVLQFCGIAALSYYAVNLLMNTDTSMNKASVGIFVLIHATSNEPKIMEILVCLCRKSVGPSKSLWPSKRVYQDPCIKAYQFIFFTQQSFHITFLLVKGLNKVLKSLIVVPG